ncbi:AMP-dependent synthetase/ligase [Anaeromyxobacter diazotrophicus]|uniref:AMP-dependent synthetase n=1 Tax=Anaeromyxobacter diazotrophicus TaxID=2590199 RepID=A0A7I9VT46_9BACT|nr:long-chain fatty acid--CoA ligase [Anaeromyxobacter diazotrophicus]GEJ59269.1 AMP-dependent synthetase [Anaeromyxobacter diazotrophicus]
MIAREELQRGAGKPRSLVDLFEATAVRLGSRAATKQKRAGRWEETSWAELAHRARDAADGLAALGVGRGDRVAILGETTTEWIVADLGVMGAAAIVVPIYQSNKAHDCQYILENSGARFVFCDSEAQVAKIREVREKLPRLEGIIRFEGAARDGFERTLAELEQAGAAWRAGHEGAHAARLAQLSLSEPACFIYTSGTTGNPKGVVLTHGNWVYEAEAVEELRIIREDDLVLCFLPMAHSFAKVIEAVWFKVGATAAFVESIEKIVDNAAEVRPTVMPSVPRIFEKAYNAVVSKGLSTPGVKGKLFAWSLKSLEAEVDGLERGEPGRGGIGLAVARRLVFPKLEKALKDRFGGRMRLFVSGGAPLSPRIAWFFQMIGFEILEGYGLTESAAGTFVNRPGQAKIGTVGPPVPGTEVRIAEDGEILIRGPGVMKEYHQNPAATAEILRDGWLYTGDIGELTRDGCLRITDRKKDIIVTAGGKNVAPQNLENELKTEPLISQVMVHGDKRKFLSALVTLNEENVRKWAQDGGLALTGPLHEDPRVRARVQAAVDALNAKQASYSTIKRFAILPRDFTQEAGELTPTLKVKRKYCTQKYRDVLDAFYAE